MTWRLLRKLAQGLWRNNPEVDRTIDAPKLPGQPQSSSTSSLRVQPECLGLGATNAERKRTQQGICILTGRLTAIFDLMMLAGNRERHRQEIKVISFGTKLKITKAKKHLQVKMTCR